MIFMRGIVAVCACTYHGRMQTTPALAMLGGLTASEFMRQYWQKKPLLVRQAFPGFKPLLSRKQLFDLAASPDVASRLVQGLGRDWQMHQGPVRPRQRPAFADPNWTLLVQGVDMHCEAASDFLQAFRFVPDARLDDLMVSWASDGGGVGPHFDSYDVFLVQAHGQRRWRYGAQKDLSLQPGLPLKILSAFKPRWDVVLNPGDMLYLPPRFAHEGTAVGECMTYSVGFRAPSLAELGRDILQRMSEQAEEQLPARLYADPHQDAVSHPAFMPDGLQAFAHQAVQQVLAHPETLNQALGEVLTEPKAHVWFESQVPPRRIRGWVLDARSRMLYDTKHIYLNGESWRASGADARLMRALADQRRLNAAQWQSASAAAKALLRQWAQQGWCHPI
jgi:50S ribosomal protein L16 3-hydroxylase